MSAEHMAGSIASRFLQTAVLIDDELVWDDEVEPTGSSEDALTPPGVQDVLMEPEVTVRPSGRPSSAIKAGKLVRGFANQRLICAPYQWKSKDDDIPEFTRKADLIVLDWKLAGGEELGTSAKAFLARRLKQDLTFERRLRYIAIYTDQAKELVLKEIAEHLDQTEGVTANLSKNEVDVVTASGALIWRISHFSKAHVDETELPGRLVAGFEAFASGLLPGVVMAAVTEMRNRTFETLFHYRSQLDQAAVCHYLALASSEMAYPSAFEDFRAFLVDLIVAEMSDAIHGSPMVEEALSREAVVEAVSSWKPPAQVLARVPKPDNGSDDCKSNDPGIVKSLFEHKTREEFVSAADSISPGKGIPKAIAAGGRKGLILASAKPDELAELAMRDLLNYHPLTQNDEFQLRSGTIIKCETGGASVYYVCVQPLCDSVRLSGETAFPLLVLKENTSNFHYIVPSSAKLVRLESKFKPSDQLMATFTPSAETGDVRTQLDPKSGERVFSSTSGESYTWVAQLKDVYSLELQSKLSEQGGRVASNKFEWLRGRSR